MLGLAIVGMCLGPVGGLVMVECVRGDGWGGRDNSLSLQSWCLPFATVL